MIRLIEGPPGSGKSFFMAKYLSKFYKYDAFYDDFTVKTGVLIISSIDGLRVPHKNLNELLLKYPVEEFFTVANFERIQKFYNCNHIVLLIDEAQKVFPVDFRNKDVEYFFQYHRHLGVDIILGTQGANLVARSFLPLCEFLIKAVPRSKGFMGNFSYHFTDLKGKFLYSKVLKKDDAIFKSYKSFSTDEITKPKNAILHWVVIASAFFIVGGLLFKSALATVKGRSEASAARSAAAVSSKPAAPVVQHNYSSPRRADSPPVEPGVSPPMLPVSTYVADVPVWRRYEYDGYIDSGGMRYYLIMGKHVPATQCRNFDRVSSTVEHYGYELRRREPSSASVANNDIIQGASVVADAIAPR